jgi:predicted secreted protein
MQLKIIKADKTHVDGVRIITVGKSYQIHHDEAVGDFIVADKGKHGLITLSDVDFYKHHYGWVTVTTYE